MTIRLDPKHSWGAVENKISAPTADDIQLFSIMESTATLIKNGKRIVSSKILSDFLRWSGDIADFLARATPEQLEELAGFAEGQLRVAFHDARKLRDMFDSSNDAVSTRETELTAAEAVADELYTRGMNERRKLSTGLKSAVEGDVELRVRVRKALGAVADHETLAGSLGRLAAVGQYIFQSPQSLAARRLVAGRITPEYLDRIAQLAAEVEAAGSRTSGARVKPTVTQGDLDRQDGICLAHMTKLMRLFNRAHERDSSIPQLVPIATRSYFGWRRSKKKHAPGEAEQK